MAATAGLGDAAGLTAAAYGATLLFGGLFGCELPRAQPSCRAKRLACVEAPYVSWNINFASVSSVAFRQFMVPPCLPPFPPPLPPPLPPPRFPPIFPPRPPPDSRSGCKYSLGGALTAAALFATVRSNNVEPALQRRSSGVCPLSLANPFPCQVRFRHG
ncbi:unnamed protein product [Closterium sp. NIES-53]